MATEKGIRGGQLSTLGASSLSALSPSGLSGIEPEFAAMMATRLFGYYRASEANDPEVFISGATKVLMGYSEQIVRLVCDPAQGLPSESKWLPNLAEIRVACERLAAPHRAWEQREKSRQHTREVTGDVRAAPVGTAEHKRVLKGFAELGEAMAARAPKDDRPKPFTLPVHEERPLYADKPLVATPEMREYLGRWIEP
jgi:hypothetical protein